MGRRKLSEMSIARLKSAMDRRIRNFPAKISWKFSAASKENRKRLEAYENSHKGKRCFVLGNGPSLNDTDLSLLKNEITFGANRLHLLEDERDFRPTYLTATDGKIIEQFSEELKAWSGPKFLRWSYRDHFADADDVTFFHTEFEPEFQRDVTRPIWGGYTVTFVNLELAFYMGFSEVILIGCDHSYAESGTPNVDIKVEDLDKNHFSPNYYAKGHTFRIPDYISQEYAFSLARKAYEADGRTIVDATIGGKLQVFPKVDFNGLFGGEGKE